MEKGSLYSDKFFEQFWVPGELTLKNCLNNSKRIKSQDFALTGMAMEGFYVTPK